MCVCVCEKERERKTDRQRERERERESSVTACPDPRIIGSTTRRVRHDDDGLTRRVKQAYIKMKTTTYLFLAPFLLVLAT